MITKTFVFVIFKTLTQKKDFPLTSVYSNTLNFYRIFFLLFKGLSIQIVKAHGFFIIASIVLSFLDSTVLTRTTSDKLMTFIQSALLVSKFGQVIMSIHCI